MQKLGGSIIDAFYLAHPPDVVVTPKLKTTSDSHLYLAACVPIVSPGFFTSLTARDGGGACRWPAFKDHLPPPGDNENVNPRAFLPDERRRTLFKGKTCYVFSHLRPSETFVNVVQACGGTAVSPGLLP